MQKIEFWPKLVLGFGRDFTGFVVFRPEVKPEPDFRFHRKHSICHRIICPPVVKGSFEEKGKNISLATTTATTATTNNKKLIFIIILICN